MVRVVEFVLANNLRLRHRVLAPYTEVAIRPRDAQHDGVEAHGPSEFCCVVFIVIAIFAIQRFGLDGLTDVGVPDSDVDLNKLAVALGRNDLDEETFLTSASVSLIYLLYINVFLFTLKPPPRKTTKEIAPCRGLLRDAFAVCWSSVEPRWRYAGVFKLCSLDI
jgi:hypothetical protein